MALLDFLTGVVLVLGGFAGFITCCALLALPCALPVLALANAMKRRRRARIRDRLMRDVDW